MSLSSDYALRTGAYDHTGTAPPGVEAAKAAAQARYDAARGGRPERLATGTGGRGMEWGLRRALAAAVPACILPVLAPEQQHLPN